MKRDTAIDLANMWHESGGQDIPGGAFDALRAALAELVPEPESSTAVKLGEEPTVLVVAGHSLYFAAATAQESNASRTVSVRSEPLDPRRSTVAMTQHVRLNQPAVDLVRTWEFARDGTSFLTLELVHRSGVAFDRGRPDVDDFAKALARKLDFDVPSDEGSAR
jgi:hypothetical protein